jgi:hypothetical protein
MALVECGLQDNIPYLAMRPVAPSPGIRFSVATWAGNPDHASFSKLESPDWIGAAARLGGAID